MVYLVAAYVGALAGLFLFALATRERERRLKAELEWLQDLASSAGEPVPPSWSGEGR